MSTFASLFWLCMKSGTHCSLCGLSQLLDVLESYCMAEGLDYSRLDGSTKAKERVKIVKEFNSSAHTNLCLVSTMWVQQSHSQRFPHVRDPVEKSPQNCCCSSWIGSLFHSPSHHLSPMPPTDFILPLFLPLSYCLVHPPIKKNNKLTNVYNRWSLN